MTVTSPGAFATRQRLLQRRLASRCAAWLTIIAIALAGTMGPFGPLSAQPPAPASDSLYTAAMNAGYDALRAGNTTDAIAAFQRALQHQPGSATAHFQLGYITLSLGRSLDAVMHFEEGLARDETNNDVRRQLGYLYAELGRTAQARQVFVRLREAGQAIPRDLVAIGNLSATLGDRPTAEQSFREAISTNDAEVVTDARAGLRNLAQTGVGAGLFAELYLAPFYQERFDNTVAIGFARAGVRGGGWLQPSVYGSLRATRDSRSTGGQQPVLFNDNTLIPAIGVRVHPGQRGLVLYAEAGMAYQLVDGEGDRWARDLRAGMNYTFAREHALRTTGNSPRLVTELSGDATFYERFDENVIAFGQWRESLRFGAANRPMFDVYARAWGAMDSRGEFFNRVVEGGGGVALHLPLGGMRASIYLDALRGRYLQAPSEASGLPRSYNDFRVTVVTGAFRFLPFERP